MTDVKVEPSIDRALRAITKPLRENGVRYMLVGALAVFAHGQPRSTRDLDVAVDVSPFIGPDGADIQQAKEKIEHILRSTGYDVEGPEQTEFGVRFWVLHPDYPVEVFLAGRSELSLEELDRATSFRIGPVEHPVISREDLVLRKLVQAYARNIRKSPNDIPDLKSVLRRNWTTFDFERVRRLAGRYDLRLVFEGLVEEVAEELKRYGA